ncbi:MAG TPA: NTP transferase domain-containing protein, partial [Acidimicrobiia bacterium]|nr:NTP transferase domain-containing protein [Acidimicrobiia bacterium]
MPVVAILPVKSFRLGKGRMTDHLSDEARSTLGRALAERTATLAVDAGLIPILVAGDGEVGEWALMNGFPSIPDPGEGLDGAALAGTTWASEASSEWIVLHADLPLLTASEVEELNESLIMAGAVIAPSADGGTSALGG